jgi:hypothetical protein
VLLSSVRGLLIVKAKAPRRLARGTSRRLLRHFLRYVGRPLGFSSTASTHTTPTNLTNLTNNRCTREQHQPSLYTRDIRQHGSQTHQQGMLPPLRRPSHVASLTDSDRNSQISAGMTTRIYERYTTGPRAISNTILTSLQRPSLVVQCWPDR